LEGFRGGLSLWLSKFKAVKKKKMANVFAFLQLTFLLLLLIAVLSARRRNSEFWRK
jgi:hypothetical protein